MRLSSSMICCLASQGRSVRLATILLTEVMIGSSWPFQEFIHSENRESEYKYWILIYRQRYSEIRFVKL